MSKINFRTLIGFAVSGFLLWLTFHNSGLELKELVLNRVQWLYFAAAVASFISATWVQSVRAKLLWLSRERKLEDISTFKSLLIGNFYNCILPGNLGEGLRAWHFSKKNNVTFSRSMAAVLAEKWIDAECFVVITAILFLVRPFCRHYIFFSIAYTAGIILVIMVVYAVMRNDSRVEKFVWRFVFLLRKPGKFFFKLYRHATQLISNLNKQGLIGYYILLCAVVLALNILQFLLLLKCAGVSAPVGGIYSAYLTAISMMIIMFIPSAPGNIGVLHYGVYATLILAANQYGIEPDGQMLQRFALFGVYLHLSYVIPEIVLGGMVLITEQKWMIGGKAIKEIGR